MNLQLDTSRRLAPPGGVGLCFLVLLSLQTLAVPAAAAPLPSPGSAPVVWVSSPPLAEGWSWRKLYRPLESALGSRRRMIQVGVIGMCIALYIMMRK